MVMICRPFLFLSLEYIIKKRKRLEKEQLSKIVFSILSKKLIYDSTYRRFNSHYLLALGSTIRQFYYDFSLHINSEYIKFINSL